MTKRVARLTVALKRGREGSLLLLLPPAPASLAPEEALLTLPLLLLLQAGSSDRGSASALPLPLLPATAEPGALHSRLLMLLWGHRGVPPS